MPKQSSNQLTKSLTNDLTNEQRKDFIDAVSNVVDSSRIIFTTDKNIVPYLSESRGRKTGKAMLAILPKTKEEISEIIKLCQSYKVSIVTQGGNTGRCFGAFCDDENSIIINLVKMDRIIDFDKNNATITVEAGCTLQQVRDYVAEHQLYFPLSIGAQGSCQIGGNLATNAGGLNTLRYGNMRNLTLGVEVVVSDGKILNDLAGLRKNNTGYDLKSIFIGSEGTLGVVTAAVLQLYPSENHDVQGLIAIDNIEQAVLLLSEAKKYFGQQLSVFELIPKIAVDALSKYTDIKFPLLNDNKNPYPYYIWYQASSNNNQILSELEEQLFEHLTEKELCLDACIAQNQAQRDLFSKIREMIVEVQSLAGESIKFDISVQVSNIAELLNTYDNYITRIGLDIKETSIVSYPFGHIGDGNIHYNILINKGLDVENKKAIKKQLENKMYTLVNQLGGSFSAEHGVGSLKTELMLQYKDPTALLLMTQIKLALDPMNIFNPKKVIPE